MNRIRIWSITFYLHYTPIKINASKAIQMLFAHLLKELRSWREVWQGSLITDVSSIGAVGPGCVPALLGVPGIVTMEPR